jgi:hypothetical protein
MKILVKFAAALSLYAFSQVTAQNDTLYVWFGGEFQGEMWHDTVYAPIGDWIDIPVFFSGSSYDVVVGDMVIPLGINKDFIDQFDSLSCQVHGVLVQWDYADFIHFNDEFQPNWASLSFVGIADHLPPYDSNWLFTGPDSLQLCLSYRVHTVEDTGLIDQTICDAVGMGWDLFNGPGVAGDTIGVIPYEIIPYFACVKFDTATVGGCDYTVGDVNNSDSYNGLDITYGVAYFKGGNPPLYECECTPGNTWYVSGTVNGDCVYNGLDIGYGVNYLKGGPGLIPCPDCPPTN